MLRPHAVRAPNRHICGEMSCVNAAAARGARRLNAKTVVTFGVLVCMALGLALAAWLFAANNAGAVFRAFATVGWGLAAVVFVRACIVVLNGTAWAYLLGGAKRLPTHVGVLLRWIREAINVVLPVANVGGEIIGARLLTFWG